MKASPSKGRVAVLFVLAVSILQFMAEPQTASAAQDPICAGLDLSLPKIDPREARRYMSNVTYRNSSIGHGNQIEHATADGRVFLWYPANQVILPGKWKLQETALTGTYSACHRTQLDLCFQYGANTYNPVTGSRGAVWECGLFDHFRKTRAEIVPGDPLGLAKMRVPPFPLPRTDQSIADIRAQLPR